MPHKLLIELLYQRSSEEFSDFLKDREFSRGETVSMTFQVTNISDSTFSGKLIQISALFRDNLESSGNTEIRIDPLAPNETRKLHAADIVMKIEGTAWITCKIVADNNEEIGFYQSRDSPQLSGKEWRLPVYVVDREKLSILKLLTEMLSKIDRIAK